MKNRLLVVTALCALASISLLRAEPEKAADAACPETAACPMASCEDKTAAEVAACCSAEASADVAACPADAAAACPVMAKSVAERADPAAGRHYLKGEVVKVLADKQGLLVKHEEIPGVMKAMTMLFKVDAATLAAAKEGQKIEAIMSRQDKAWLLTDVTPVVAARKAE